MLSDVVFNQHKPEWLGFAASQRLPGMYQQLEWIPAGGLMAPLADNLDLARRAGLSNAAPPATGQRAGDVGLAAGCRLLFSLRALLEDLLQQTEVATRCFAHLRGHDWRGKIGEA
jgi:hypothetical protein